MTDEATTSEEMIKVGEHSAYKSVEELKKGKLEADNYIAKLLEEMKQKDAIIDDLRSKANVAKELKQIREGKMNTENTNTQDVTEDTIKQIALRAMQETNKAEKEMSNLNDCKKALSTINSDVELAMQNKAKELGCTVEYLESIAKNSPKAFKSMFGIKENVTFDSINFLQSSRQISNDIQDSIKSLGAHPSPKAVAELMDKALKNPEILNSLNKW